MEDTVRLYEAIRPRGNRDEAGEQGEKLHQLADILEARDNQTMVVKNPTFYDLAVALRGLSISEKHQELLEAGFSIFITAHERSSATTSC